MVRQNDIPSRSGVSTPTVIVGFTGTSDMAPIAYDLEATFDHLGIPRSDVVLRSSKLCC